MKYLECDEIKYLQIDHNSTCNLRCAQCARTHNGDTHPDLPMLELSVDSYKKFSIVHICIWFLVTIDKKVLHYKKD